jgi:hypothetical protein
MYSNVALDSRIFLTDLRVARRSSQCLERRISHANLGSRRQLAHAA